MIKKECDFGTIETNWKEMPAIINRVLKRLRKRYEEKHDFNCICDCYDATIVKYSDRTLDVWHNWDLIKFNFGELEPYGILRTSECPICGRRIPTQRRPTKTNGYRVI